MTRNLRGVALLAAAWLSTFTLATPPADGFRELADGYVRSYLAAHPVRAGRLGIHDHDDRLPDLSPRGVRTRIRELRRWQARIASAAPSTLPEDEALDYRILDRAVKAELLELEELRSWQRDPMLYTRLLSGAVAGLVEREFAPLDERLRLLVARLEGFPRLIATGRKNLRDVPRVWAELGLRNTRGTLQFLQRDVPAALRAQGLDRTAPRLVRRWERAHRRALGELEAFAAWLERDLLPRADGDFRLGRDLLERKLRYEEHVTLTVDELRALNEKAIDRYRSWIAKVAAEIDPSSSVAAVVQRVAGEFPSPEALISTARRNVVEAREFVVERGLVTLPTEGLPIVRPTPAYARTGFASMSTPGPFETRATESYYNITNVDPAWTAEQQRQHLTYFNYPGLLGVSIHEAMPGHFVQLLYQRELPTDLRKVFAPASLIEGWAHYVEQMMLDEGFRDGDPRARLGQLRRALQRHARWHASLALHVDGAPLEQVAREFAEIAYFAEFPALRETRRATYDPTYLHYALGRMQILELRDDYRKQQLASGESFSLGEFHDRFLRLGLPLDLARRVMLGADDAVSSDRPAD